MTLLYYKGWRWWDEDEYEDDDDVDDILIWNKKENVIGSHVNKTKESLSKVENTIAQ